MFLKYTQSLKIMSQTKAKTKKILKVKCPKCRLQFEYYKSDFRPFCSEKCKMVDLGHWFEESYQFQSPIASEDDFREYEKALLEKGIDIHNPEEEN